MIGDPYGQNPYGQNPYGQILQRTMSRMQGLENMGNVAPLRRPQQNNPQPMGLRRSPLLPQQASRNPYNFNFGNEFGQGFGSPLATRVTY
jgi:hypothetical protein